MSNSHLMDATLSDLQSAAAEEIRSFLTAANSVAESRPEMSTPKTGGNS